MTRRRRLVALVAALLATVLAPVALPGASVPAGAAPPPAVDPGIAGVRPVDELLYDLGAEVYTPESLGVPIELRGKVYAPADGSEAAPLVLLVHGRHVTCGGADEETVSIDWPCAPGVPEIPSYKGYDALGRNLASHGYVVASIGVNGINANDGFVEDGGAAARAELIMETLRRIQAWSTSATGSPLGSRLVGRVDLTRVGLMGHSRGGEGVVAAANLNQAIGSPFGIKAVLALAPVDFGRRILSAVPLGVILPDCDGDVSDLQGADYYDDSRYAAVGDPASRSTFHVRGAQHNAFNTVWTVGPGSSDDAEYSGRPECAQGAAGRLSPTQQNVAGASLMAGYLRRYVTDEVGFQRLVTGTAPYPASVGPARWTTAFFAPQRLDIERWDSAATVRRSRTGAVAAPSNASPGVVCNPSIRDRFMPGQARIEVPCPDYESLGFVHDTGLFDLGWTGRGVFVRRPLAAAGVDVTAFDGVRFRAAAGRDARNQARPTILDLSVVLEDATGARASAAVRPWSSALAGQVSRHPLNVVLSGVRIPLSAFAGVDLTRIRAVEIRADRTDGGRVHLADLAFTAEGTDTAAGPALPSSPPPATVCGRSADARYVCSVGRVLFGRDPGPDEVQGALPLARTASGRSALITWWAATPEAFELRLLQHAQPLTQASVDSRTLLDGLSPAARRSWESAVQALAGDLVGSFPSYSTPAQIVDALYELHLGIPADPAGRAYWVAEVRRGRNPTDLSRQLRTTVTARRAIVSARYRQVVGYAPDTASRNYWVGRLSAGGGEKALVVSLLSTERFRQTAVLTT